MKKNFPNPNYPIDEYLQLRWEDPGLWDDIFEKTMFNKECCDKLVSHTVIDRNEPQSFKVFSTLEEKQQCLIEHLSHLLTTAFRCQ